MQAKDWIHLIQRERQNEGILAVKRTLSHSIEWKLPAKPSKHPTTGKDRNDRSFSSYNAQMTYCHTNSFTALHITNNDGWNIPRHFLLPMDYPSTPPSISMHKEEKGAETAMKLPFFKGQFRENEPRNNAQTSEEELEGTQRSRS